MGGLFNKEITSLSDMEGLKMRIPGLGAKVMDKLGVTVQVIPGGEIFQALQTGAIQKDFIVAMCPMNTRIINQVVQIILRRNFPVKLCLKILKQG